MARHTRAEIRKARKRAIHRKMRICHEVYHFPWYRDTGRVINLIHNNFEGEIPGMYSKGKIHCSCYLCKHFKKDKVSAYSQKKRMERMDTQEKEYNSGL